VTAPAALRRIEVVTIGDELLLGFTIDTNAAHLARELAAMGIEVVRRATVGDDAPAIRDAVGQALARTGAVITTGGLGPTSDDLTKPAIAELFAREMVLDAAHLRWMQERWRSRFGREMPESNRAQAMLPAGAIKLPNNHGSAPGIWLEDADGRFVAMLPGVPREMRGMLADTLLPRLAARRGSGAGTVVRSRTLRTTGIAESLLADRIAPLGPLESMSLAYLPGLDGVDLRLTVRDLPAPEADARLGQASTTLLSTIGDTVYAEDSADLAEVVLSACRRAGKRVAVAESCTGGMLGMRLSAVPGSSDVFLGGVIAYHDDVKRHLLGVPDGALRDHGAVSEPVARAMAAGARTRTGAEIGVAITGVAGPGGGSEQKPVGTVWVAWDVDGDVEAERLQLWGDRHEVRYRAGQAALARLRRRL